MRKPAPKKPKRVKEDFVFPLVKDGETTEIILPSLSYIPPRMLNDHGDLSPQQFVMLLINEYLSDDERKLFWSTVGEDAGAFDDFYEAWQRHSGTDVGES